MTVPEHPFSSLRGLRALRALRVTRVSSWSGLAAGGVLAGAALLAAGCTNPLAHHESDDAVRVPAERLQVIDRLELGRYEAPAPEGAPAGPPAEAPDRFAGMKTLPITLEEVRAAVLENNLDLQVALVNPVIAGESLRAEEAKFEAVFVPSFSYSEDDAPTFDVTASNAQDSIFGSLGVEIPLRTGGRARVDLTQSWRETANPFVTLPTSYSNALRFSLSQPLLRNAGRRANTHSIRIAQIDEQISRAQTKLEVIRVVADADRAYWLLYSARRALDVAQQQYELASDQLESARRLLDAGAVAEIEVIRAESGVAQRLEAIINAENVVLLRQRQLKRAMNIPGLDVGTDVVLTPATEPNPMRFDFDPASLSAAAVDNRMEMLELELRLAADLSNIEFAENQKLPLFALDYSYTIASLGNTFRQSWDQLADNDFESWSVGVSGQVPLGNEAAEARLQVAILSRLQRLSTREARALAIREEVLNAIDNADAGWQRIMAARQAVIAAARALQAEQSAFEAGDSTSQDVLDAATTLADAQSSEISALTSYQIALTDLAFATGTLLGEAKVEWAPLDPRADDGMGPATLEEAIEGE